MSNFITSIWNSIQDFFSYITAGLFEFFNAITTAISQPAILPDLWEALPEEIQAFFLGIVVINLFIIVFFGLVRKN